MESERRQTHWDEVYTSKDENEVSWFQESPAPSLEIIALTSAKPTSAVIDIGGGSSRLVDALLDMNFQAVTVLDLSEFALNIAKTRLGHRAHKVTWLVADVTKWEPSAVYDIWHDRAALHFLTEEADRAAYVRNLTRALQPGGYAVIATFSPDGPDHCSGLAVRRYDAKSLGRLLGAGFELAETRNYAHQTPWGSRQAFQFSLFRRTERASWRFHAAPTR
jgi:trans-aconitate methyltransferase